MKIISYAQNYEDVLLNRLFPDRPGGFYIDVGAYHPVFHSVTKLFYERGWQGVNIEPIPSMFKLLADDRPRDVNLHMGLSNVEGNLTFYEVPADMLLSTFAAEHAEGLRQKGLRLEERSIPVTTLARVCEQYAGQTIDFLKIDVESHEREVLEGADWGRYRPRVVLIEATRPATPIPSYEHWEPILLAADYLFAFFDGLNRYYVRAEDRQFLPLLSVPANIFDEFEQYEYYRPIQELRHALEASQEWCGRTQIALDGTRSALDETQSALMETQQALKDSQIALQGLRARLAPFEQLGPIAIGVARWMRRMATRYPRLASVAKRVIRRARPRAAPGLRDVVPVGAAGGAIPQG